MSQGDQNSLINQEDKEKMLDDLESLSRMLDDEQEDEENSRIVPEDIPVLKSFVDDVPVLNETLDEDDVDSSPDEPAEPPTLQSTDSLDLNAANFRATPVNRPVSAGASGLDMSFLDKDPLDISDRVRNYRNPTASSATQPAVTEPTANAQAVSTPSQKAEDVTRPLNRFQPSTSSENPFLPRSTLDKIRENHAWEQKRNDDNDASAQLRKLLQDNPLNKVTFDPNSKEVQALRQKASQLVNDVIRANMPRLEAELRMKLEQEVDRMFKEIKKNPR